VAYEDWIKGESTDLHAAPTHATILHAQLHERDDGTAEGHSARAQGFSDQLDLYPVKVLGITENDRTFSIARLFFTLGLGSICSRVPCRREHDPLLAAAPEPGERARSHIARYKPTFYLMSRPATQHDGRSRGSRKSTICRRCAAAWPPGEALPGALVERVEGKDGARDH